MIDFSLLIDVIKNVQPIWWLFWTSYITASVFVGMAVYSYGPDEEDVEAGIAAAMLTWPVFFLIIIPMALGTLLYYIAKLGYKIFNIRLFGRRQDYE